MINNLKNSRLIDQNFLIDAFISEFDDEFNLKRNIQSEKIDIKKKKWEIYNPKIFEKLVCVCDVIEYAASPVTVWFPWFTSSYVNVGLLNEIEVPVGMDPDTPVTLGEDVLKVAEAVELVPSYVFIRWYEVRL